MKLYATTMACGHVEDVNLLVHQADEPGMCMTCIEKLMPLLRRGPPPWSAADQRRIDQIKRR